MATDSDTLSEKEQARLMEVLECKDEELMDKINNQSQSSEEK